MKKTKPKLLISTPCSNGLIYEGYAGSLLHCVNRALAEDLVESCQVYFEGKESLIHRARNRAALYALEKGFDKLLTIDADIVWTWEDFKKIISHEEPIVGGCYPLKTFPVVMNFNTLDGKGTEFLTTGRGYDYDAFMKFQEKYADPVSKLVEVRHIPTGFLCTSVEVLSKLSETVEVYFNRQSEDGQVKGYFHLYPSGVVEKILESEDWGFCRIASEAGYKLYLDTSILLGHIGYHTFRLGQFYGEAQKQS